MAIALGLSPFWFTPLPGYGGATVGRVALLVAAGFVALAFLRDRPDHLRILPTSRPAAAVAVALLGLLAWIALNAATLGCSCKGGLYGFAEFTAGVLLVGLVASVAPEWRARIIGAATLGVVMGGILAAVGIGELGASLTGSSSSNRLAGVYGNSNFLAFALALAIPGLLAFALFGVHWPRARLWRPASGIAFAGLLVLIVLTFSRGGAIEAAVGLVVVAAAYPRTLKTRVMVAVACALALTVAGGLAYPGFERDRQQADLGFSQSNPTLTPKDRSGWDTSAQGVIPVDGSRIGNSLGDAVLGVSTARAGQGASLSLERAARAAPLTVTFEATADSRLRLLYALEDNLRGNRPAMQSRVIGKRWRKLRVVWRPSRQSDPSRVYFWQQAGRTQFFLRDINVVRSSIGRPVSTPVATRLLGAAPPPNLRGREKRFLDSRWAGVDLSLSAVSERPLTGIGWETFPTYANRRAEFGALPTHNEFLRFAAELGVPGLILLGIAGLGAAIGASRLERGPVKATVVGTLCAALVGLQFANALVVTGAVAPLVAALGVACSSGQPPTTTRTQPAETPEAAVL